MPRTKLDKKNEDLKRLEELIRTKVYSHKTNLSKTSNSIGFRSNKTIYCRLKSPDSFSIGELRKLRRFLQISQEDLIEAIKPLI